MSKLSRTSVFLGGLLFALASVPASASFLGQTVDFTFSESPYADEVSNGVQVIDPGLELEAGDGSGIGDVIMLAGESIEIGVNTITFTIRGDSAPHAVAGYQTTGFGADATYLITGFNLSFNDLFDVPAGGNIAMELDNIIGVSLGSELIIGSDFISLNVGTLGVGEIIGGIDIGTITLRAVPLPATFILMMSGLLGLAGVARRRIRS